MAAASNSSTSPVQAHNSPRSRHSRRSSAARGNPPPSESSPPPLSLSEIVDQEPFGTPSSTASFESPLSKESNTVVAESGYLGEDGSPPTAGADGSVDNGENGGAAKKAWNKPSNVPAAEVSAVMGAESWPALSESARASPKSPSTYSVKSPSHGSITASQEMAAGSVSSPKKLNTNISTQVSSSSSAAPVRQKSMKRGGSGLSHNTMAANGSLAQALPTADAATEEAHSNPGKSGGPVVESPRDNIQRDAGRKGGSHGGGEQQHRGSFRRNNSGSFSRGDGSYHHSNGGRRDRDQDRGKQDWGNSHNRSFGRESQSPHQRVASAPNAPFIPPPPVVLPFPPMVYTDMPTPVYYVPGPLPESVRPIPMVQLSPVYLPMPDPNLASKIVNQIDYYFSNENLVKDTFLRRNMDSEGWVSINLIAGFKKVMQLTDNIQIILDAIQASNVVEVQGDKLRRKNDWIKWIMPLVQSPQLSNESNPNALAARVSNVTLDE